MYLTMDVNSCLHLPSVGMTGVCHQCQLALCGNPTRLSWHSSEKSLVLRAVHLWLGVGSQKRVLLFFRVP